jgi:integrating conjugative element protein (TIGR03749 family)
MKKLITLLAMMGLLTSVYGDDLSSLTLTDAEMQKLKQFFPDEDNNHFIWKGDPILIQLSVGKENRLVFPSPIKADLKADLIKSGELKILNNDKSLYLTAAKPFALTRLLVTLLQTGEVILIDLSVSEKSKNPSNTQYIEIKNEKSTTSNVAASTSIDNDSLADVDKVSYVEMIRFAWQQMYAPNSFLEEGRHFPRIAMHTNYFEGNLVYGDKVIAHPEASWIAGNTYVTAIAIQNKYPLPITVSTQKDLCGDWLAATIYPSGHLKAHDHELADNATLFLVSKKPFNEILRVCHGDASNE